MDNYNSLTEQLIQNGILKKEEASTIEEKNFFENPNGELFAQENPVEAYNENEINNKENHLQINQNRKRLNQYDLEFLENKKEFEEKNPFKKLKQIFKKDEEAVLFKLFPNLQKAKLAKETISKLAKLNIDTQNLLDKSIPYGEGETRYKNLVKYLSVVNEVQSKIKKN